MTKEHDTVGIQIVMRKGCLSQSIQIVHVVLIILLSMLKAFDQSGDKA